MPSSRWKEHAVAGLEVIRGAGAVDDAVEVARLHAGLGERAGRCLSRQTCTPVSPSDTQWRVWMPGALRDPLVRRVHHFGEVVIGHAPRGDVKAGGENLGTGHRGLRAPGCGASVNGKISPPAGQSKASGG